MTYPESIEFLYGLRLFGLKLGLETTRQLAALAGNPQERLRFIHIAGTNGKGSVAAMLESVYRASGLRVGLYTSPHLISFRERIQVNRHLIDETDVVRLVEEMRERSSAGVAPAPDKRKKDRRDACATFFEFVTVLALRYFAEQRCDLVIWETGLGGRLDATNIVTPLASVITNIEPDHQRWLGHDLKSIATEKAGIIKPGVPIVTATSKPEALAAVENIAVAQQSPLTLVTAPHASQPPLDELKLPLPGWHQRMNAATVLATVQALQEELPVSGEAIQSGLEHVQWPGRMQLLELNHERRILLDGAHNVAGATSLRALLETDYAHTPMALILGILEDKDWELMCEQLAPVADHILCVPIKSDRATDPQKLAETCRRTNKTIPVKVAGSIKAALDELCAEPFVVVAGSLYLVGEALEALGSGPRTGADERQLNEFSSSSNASTSNAGNKWRP